MYGGDCGCNKMTGGGVNPIPYNTYQNDPQYSLQSTRMLPNMMGGKRKSKKHRKSKRRDRKSKKHRKSKKRVRRMRGGTAFFTPSYFETPSVGSVVGGLASVNVFGGKDIPSLNPDNSAFQLRPII